MAIYCQYKRERRSFFSHFVISAQVREIKHPGKVYSDIMNLILRLASYGLIHGDFNEFNLMINDNQDIFLIDFPQMVSTSHINAEM